MELSKKANNKIKKLVALCKSTQGEYLSSEHGSGSWATTYSLEFINSASELYLLFKNANALEPLSDMSKLFREAGIRSCRGAEFHRERVEYLFKSHLRHRVEQLTTKAKLLHKTVKCEYCEKSVINLTMHVSQAHPEKWRDFSLQNNVDLKGKTRCASCGSFLKKIEGHNLKCLKTLTHTN
mgnify:CR=1 FL=1|tara:strand:+ start:1426 stop:1968 length:543 start_codon:yes stop_codon:yes gene_type:complete